MTAEPPVPERHTGVMRRVLRAVSTVLIAAGALLILDAGATVAWQEPVSAVYAKITQDRLGSELDRISVADLSAAQRDALRTLRTEQRRMAFLARALRRDVQEGDPVGRIRSKRIGIDYVVVEGTDPATLRKGPGHYTQTSLPGLSGTVAIAGHRTTYAAPFRELDTLRPRDRITVEMPYGTFTYAVQRTKIVSPKALWVIRRQSYDRLVLTACHPLYSAARRIVVFARLVGSTPRGAAVVDGGA